MKQASKIRKIAFLGDYWPRKCGIATFTSDLLTAVAAEHPQSQCFSVAVNDTKGGYEYPDEVHLPGYRLPQGELEPLLVKE